MSAKTVPSIVLTVTSITGTSSQTHYCPILTHSCTWKAFTPEGEWFGLLRNGLVFWWVSLWCGRPSAMAFCAAHSASNGSGLCRKDSAALIDCARKCSSGGCDSLPRDPSSETLLVNVSSHWSGLGRSRTGGVWGGVGGVVGFQSPVVAEGNAGEGEESNLRASSLARNASLPVIGRCPRVGLLSSKLSLSGCEQEKRLLLVVSNLM